MNRSFIARQAICETNLPRGGMIEECDAGVKAQELCRKYGISDATFYKYKAKFGGMNVSDVKKLRALEDENNRLKRMLADAMLHNAALKDLATKKSLTLDLKRRAVPDVMDRHGLSERPLPGRRFGMAKSAERGRRVG